MRVKTYVRSNGMEFKLYPIQKKREKKKKKKSELSSLSLNQTRIFETFHSQHS